MHFTETDGDGNDWEVSIETDIRHIDLPVVYPDHEMFDYDADLKWDSSVFSWRVGDDTAHEAVNLRSFHYEPPTDTELQEMREQRDTFLNELVAQF